MRDQIGLKWLSAKHKKMGLVALGTPFDPVLLGQNGAGDHLHSDSR